MSTRRICRFIPTAIWIALTLVIVLPDCPLWNTSAQDLDFEEEFMKGRELFRRRKYEDALKSFKRANDLRDKKSAECFGWMCETYLAMGAYKNAIESADRVIELAKEDQRLIVRAYNNKGLALQAWADRKDEKKLQAAEAVFRQGMAMKEAPYIMRYNLALTLLQLNRDEEGVAMMREYIKLQPNSEYVEVARKMAENPRRARENFAPDFSFVSSEGEHIALDDLRGKVVLLDFWGTWCPPCVESVPEIRRLYERYSKDGSLLILGISSDDDEDEWREFTAKHKMVWPQYRDSEARMLRAFRIRAFPTYVVIDHEGVVQFQDDGVGPDTAAKLEATIRKQLKLIAKTAAAR